MIITLRISPESNCFNQEGMADTVHLQLKPGLQYVIDVPMANSPLQPALTPDPTPSIPKAASGRSSSCHVCGKECRDYFNLTRHFQGVHTVKENGFTCRHGFLSFLYAYLAHEKLNCKLIFNQFTLPGLRSAQCSSFCSSHFVFDDQSLICGKSQPLMEIFASMVVASPWSLSR